MESPVGEKGDKGEADDSNPKSTLSRLCDEPTGLSTNGWQSGSTDRRPSGLKNTAAAETKPQDAPEGRENLSVLDHDPYPDAQEREPVVAPDPLAKTAAPMEAGGQA